MRESTDVIQGTLDMLILKSLGIVLGLAAAAGLTRVMSHLLYGITATDTTTFAAVPAIFAGVALGACYVAARRTARVDPVDALRHT